ncbi:hypothetical protein [Pedobacter endophyticus]|uniref:Uncharacterized protein n=1 Tax=Pedobacter endophyticus TaxID=2789740 RepID=A0A7S9KZ86_9SPHI|nr:hypothetical protein [Pedobacter endophyticus]QPH39556.1 hypothetical protein IZT61_21370 [Pedobacter endophyticus]
MKTTAQKLRQQIKLYIWTIIVGLALSGLTAFPIETEMEILVQHNAGMQPSLQNWLNTVHGAIKTTNINYPFLSYGTDWLAFAHLMLAILFLGPLRNPLKNEWIIEFGIICCLSIIPLALIAGYVRSIPLFWRFIDCAFGIVGIIPLLLCYRNIQQLKRLETN